MSQKLVKLLQQTLVELFKQTINKELHLKRTGKVWQLKETPLITMEAPNLNSFSFGFSLDCKPSPFNFLFNGSPPLDIAKMCDAIIVLSYKNRAFIFVIEQKTSRTSGSQKQLTNGKYFCDWLLALLKEHRHYDEEVTFIALLCWQPRKKSPLKGGTRHESIVSSKDPAPCHQFFKVKNKTDVHLLEFIK